MRKFLMVMLMVGIFAVCIGCGSHDEKKATENNKPAPTATTTSSDMGTPKFKNPEVQKYVDDYAAIIKQVKDTKPGSQDASKLTEKAEEMQRNSVSVVQKLAADQDELKKFNDYMITLANQLQQQNH